MRTIIIALCFIFCMVAIAYSETTSGATYTSPNGEVCEDFIGFLNDQEYIDHSHQYEIPERDDPMGIGLDAIVWQNEKKNTAVELQEKYDISNSENSLFAVVKLNLFEILKKKTEPVVTEPIKTE